jgi:hypothetical protein
MLRRKKLLFVLTAAFLSSANQCGGAGSHNIANDQNRVPVHDIVEDPTKRRKMMALWFSAGDAEIPEHGKRAIGGMIESSRKASEHLRLIAFVWPDEVSEEGQAQQELVNERRQNVEKVVRGMMNPENALVYGMINDEPEPSGGFLKLEREWIAETILNQGIDKHFSGSVNDLAEILERHGGPARLVVIVDDHD